ncbi:MAG: pilus assembly protein [Planctomycetaceae bacterium]|nr:pilus assembly protein [Planctomycetaceae bacterium]
MLLRKRQHDFKRERLGGATVEFALCLPLMIMLVFGSMEASNALFLRQGLSIAAYEAAQVATQSGMAAAAAEARAQEVLDARNIAGYAVTISPQVTATTSPGTTVTVTVTAPIDANSLGPSWYFTNSVIRSTVTMRRL